MYMDWERFVSFSQKVKYSTYYIITITNMCQNNRNWTHEHQVKVTYKLICSAKTHSFVNYKYRFFLFYLILHSYIHAITPVHLIIIEPFFIYTICEFGNLWFTYKVWNMPFNWQILTWILSSKVWRKMIFTNEL